jgi:hypothetical protein
MAQLVSLWMVPVSSFSPPSFSTLGKQRYKHSQELDEKALLSKSTFPIKPDDLIDLAKQNMDKNVLMGIADGGACLAPDFSFAGPVVGPLSREKYLQALQGFRLADSWDINPQFFGFTVDPLQPNRVWFMGRSKAVQIAPFAGVEPVPGQVVELPPQCFHMDFNGQGKITRFGFATADRLQGNAGGLGGVFGYFYAVGRPLPFPEAKPFEPTWQYKAFNAVGTVIQNLGIKF